MTVLNLDSVTALYVSDANGTVMSLVELGNVPTDGTWEVLQGTGESGLRWGTVAGKIEGYHRMLVVARPIGSDDG